MQFKESFITDAGQVLFARAAAQEGRVTWTRTATSDLDTGGYTVAQMNAITEETFGTKTLTGQISSAVVDDARKTVAVACELSNDTTHGYARTLGLWAKIEGDSEETLVIVARNGTGVEPVYVSQKEDIYPNIFFFDFTLSISSKQAQAIEVSASCYATAQGLQAEADARESLAQRVVTAHLPDNQNAGELQTIHGRKTFADGITGNLTGNVTGNLNGRIPTKSTQGTWDNTLPNGMIFLAMMKSKSSSPGMIKTGTQLNMPSSTWQIFPAMLAVDKTTNDVTANYDPAREMTTGSYVVLNDTKGGQDRNFIALLMSVS